VSGAGLAEVAHHSFCIYAVEYRMHLMLDLALNRRAEYSDYAGSAEFGRVSRTSC